MVAREKRAPTCDDVQTMINLYELVGKLHVEPSIVREYLDTLRRMADAWIVTLGLQEE